MSTQFSMPQTPKGPRPNSRRTQKRNTAPCTQNAGFVTTPPTSPPRKVSPGGIALESSNNTSQSKKKGARPAKKPRENQSSAVHIIGHRHTSSQPNVTTPLHIKASPHYAGPTFHASPAPSALPMPSFLSKSVPDSDLAPHLETNDDMEADAELQTTPSKSKPRVHSDDERKSTPLDFLFKAATEARNAQAVASPEHDVRNSFPNHSDPRTPSSLQRPDSMTGGIFPIELETAKSTSPSIGPSFAASFQDRMNALRSSSSPSTASEHVDESQRRAKNEALKDLLLNPRPQLPSCASPFSSPPLTELKQQGHGGPGLFRQGVPLRTSSGPASPVYGSRHGQKWPSENDQQFYFATDCGSVPKRPDFQSHALNRGAIPSAGVPSDLPKRSVSSVYYESTTANGCSIKSSAASPLRLSSPSRSLPANASASKVTDTKKIEDDLRRILKLDASNGVQGPSVQSSLA